MTPLREEIENFRNRINDIHTKETSARASLKTQFETQMTELKQSNIKISDEANNLAHALKNDKKMQGDWGEIALEKLLEDSGLRKGEEYQSQESVRDENGNTVRPDVIIRLPDGKHLIVDSKVSLVAYSQYVVAEDKNPINNALAKHVEAIKTHVKTLSEKHYQMHKALIHPILFLCSCRLNRPILPLYPPIKNYFRTPIIKKSYGCADNTDGDFADSGKNLAAGATKQKRRRNRQSRR